MFGKKCLYSGKRFCIPTKWLYSGKMVVFGQSGYIRANVVVLGKKRLYSGKSDCNRAKCLNSEMGCFIRAKSMYFNKSIFIWEKWLY